MLSTSQSVDLNRWVRDLDTSVNEVFVRMLGMPCAPVDGLHASEERLKVTIGVTGRIQTTCSLYFSLAAAQSAVSALAGEELSDWESLAHDAVGEIGNMIVGSLKRKADGAHVASVMSVPSVSREPAPHPTIPLSTACSRDYGFVGNTMQIEFTVPRVA